MISSGIKYILFATIFFSSCNWFAPFSPSTPLENKWVRIEKWVPSDSTYFFLIDINKAAKTPFYKKAILGNTNKYLAILSNINPETEAGIIAITDKFVFIGGDFEATDLIERIKEGIETKKGALKDTVYKKRTIYYEKDGGPAFAMLEKYLVCYGGMDDIKKLIDDRPKKKIVPVKADTSFTIWGIINKDRPIVFTADLGERLEISATANFPGEKETEAFAEEAVGIKTIKSLEYMDEPWLADFIDGIAILKGGDKVVIKSAMDVDTAKKLIKKGFK